MCLAEDACSLLQASNYCLRPCLIEGAAGCQHAAKDQASTAGAARPAGHTRVLCGVRGVRQPLRCPLYQHHQSLCKAQQPCCQPWAADRWHPQVSRCHSAPTGVSAHLGSFQTFSAPTARLREYHWQTSTYATQSSPRSQQVSHPQTTHKPQALNFTPPGSCRDACDRSALTFSVLMPLLHAGKADKRPKEPKRSTGSTKPPGMPRSRGRNQALKTLPAFRLLLYVCQCT